ncbi:U6 snRNA-associated Sm-like protein LSm7 [Mustela nigripes]|uniref:U6 snRNA-associated Sm-like protein LSm7 n=1 Tax=Mustela nigripes TaxID=77151 RepID=UPI0028155A58|nr:U6 snRNA-associated Sm-like protein LSm7 [Mustela nigripes]
MGARPLLPLCLGRGGLCGGVGGLSDQTAGPLVSYASHGGAGRHSTGAVVGEPDCTGPRTATSLTPLCFSSRWFLQASGILKGFDPLLNLVLDGTVEYMRDPDDQYKLTEDTRQLGLVVCRGTSVVLICPQDGMEAIPNPFIQQQDA